MVFGFSRGAYAARTIAGLISDIGICEPKQLHDFHEVWEAYKANYTGDRFEGSKEWFDYIDGVPGEDKDQPDDFGYKNRNFVWKKRPKGAWARTPESKEIEVVGVFDTVGALGLPDLHGFKMGWGPDKYEFHSEKLNPSKFNFQRLPTHPSILADFLKDIKHAFHALALDEHREAFAPTLWHLPQRKKASDNDLEDQQKLVDDAEAAWYPKAYDKNVPLKERQRLKSVYNNARRDLWRMEESRKPRSELLQVWFPGGHMNIGGGSNATMENEGDLEGKIQPFSNRNRILFANPCRNG